MRNKTLITFAALALAALVACNKDAKNEPANPRQSVKKADLSNLKPLPQKFYDISGKRTMEIVKGFKAGITKQGENNSNIQGRLIEADSVALDSSIFVLEAALNYDFDYQHSDPVEQMEELPIDTTQFSIPITRSTTKVHSDDLEEVYEELGGYIESQISSTIKVKIVDVEAYFVGTNQITYRALVIKHYLPAQEYYCGANTSGGYACSVFPNPPDATEIIKHYLRHCDYPLTDCVGTFYTQAVTNPNNNSTNAFSGSLYYATFNPPVVNDLTLFTSSQVNTYRTSCYNLAQSGLTSLSSNHKIVGINLTIGWVMQPVPLGVNKTYWSLPVTYGIPVTLNCP